MVLVGHGFWIKNGYKVVVRMKDRTEGPVPCATGKCLFDKAWDALIMGYALAYADYLEHVGSCDLCIKRLKLTDHDIQTAKEMAKGYRLGVKYRDAKNL